MNDTLANTEKKTAYILTLPAVLLVFAIVFGFLIWSEVPKILTLFGALLVIASSLIIFTRESQLKKQIVNPRS